MDGDIVGSDEGNVVGTGVGIIVGFGVFFTFCFPFCFSFPFSFSFPSTGQVKRKIAAHQNAAMLRKYIIVTKDPSSNRFCLYLFSK